MQWHLTAGTAHRRLLCVPLVVCLCHSSFVNYLHTFLPSLPLLIPYLYLFSTGWWHACATILPPWEESCSPRKEVHSHLPKTPSLFPPGHMGGGNLPFTPPPWPFSGGGEGQTEAWGSFNFFAPSIRLLAGMAWHGCVCSSLDISALLSFFPSLIHSLGGEGTSIFYFFTLLLTHFGFGRDMHSTALLSQEEPVETLQQHICHYISF